ncbi:SDR family NAD(P)-dependent oxidoreductase [Actinorugispora endophytica]|uniref:NAD(P)-dependent dehydrogenase (Short-subunit alcohol dehydrogenase family) n=1 Tax=Actinorugispora endophytica TaxID=1605990 RepID=A0A4V3D946_9ACTN|nr:SDR family NAD(P)-dependent oxidoreductase [Actinorugispora endophytica]TDQ54359.1 NAD(P)-dependent dehydrogenase (short-subunit alcohol dehydrogenase family) [Actinorugispora endophytica]
MTTDDRPITAGNSVEEWFAHPVGGPVLRELIERSGQDEDALRPVGKLPLARLVELAGDRFPQELVDELVIRANGGVAPVVGEEEDEEPETPPGGARFTGRTVIVTGAASGIGRATAARIAREGGRVVGVDIAEDRLRALVDGAPEGSVVPVAGDITKDEDIARIVAAAGERVDGLANVAGIMDDMSPLHEVSDQAWERVFAVNVDGAFKLSRAVLPSMLAAGRGAIVNVTSEAALRGNAAGAAYTASKHAVVGITRSSAFMYGPQGIRVNAVAPGPVATGIEGAFGSAFAKARMGEFMRLIPPVAEAARLAASITWLLSDDSDNVNGVVLASDGGWSVQ